MSPISEKPPMPTPDQPLKAENPFSGQVEEEAVKNFVEPTPLDQLIPGIDLSKLTKESRQQFLEAKIGRAQADTSFFNNTYSTLIDIGVFEYNEHEMWAERFKGKTIVDIGPGASSIGYEFAQETGATAYVAVEPFFASHTKNSIERYISNNPNERLVQWNCVREDGLAFIEALPKDSVCVVMAGIDGIIPRERMEDIIREIQRVLDPDGAFLSIYSDTYQAADIMDRDPSVKDNQNIKQFIKRKAVV